MGKENIRHLSTKCNDSDVNQAVGLQKVENGYNNNGCKKYHGYAGDYRLIVTSITILELHFSYL